MSPLVLRALLLQQHSQHLDRGVQPQALRSLPPLQSSDPNARLYTTLAITISIEIAKQERDMERERE